MEGEFESIQKLLATTGLSCDDLLAQLSRFKNLQGKKSAEDDSPATSKETTKESVESDKVAASEVEDGAVGEKQNNQKGKEDVVEEEIFSIVLEQNIVADKQDSVTDDQDSVAEEDTRGTEKGNSDLEKKESVTGEQVSVDVKTAGVTGKEGTESDTAGNDKVEDIKDNEGTNEEHKGIQENSRESQYIRRDEFHTYACISSTFPLEESKEEIEEEQQEEDKSTERETFAIEKTAETSTVMSETSNSLVHDEDETCSNVSKDISNVEAKNCDKVATDHVAIDTCEENARGCADSDNDDRRSLCSSEGDTTLDDVRDSIRMQLSFLRNKKKEEGVLPVFEKKSISSFENLKKKRRQSSMAEDETSSSLVSLSDETELKIVEVVGGVDVVNELAEAEEENVSKEDEVKTEECPESLLLSVKSFFLNKKRKLHEHEQALTPIAEDVPTSTVAPSTDITDSNGDSSNADSNNTNPEHEVASKLKSTSSPFISDSLENFLTESAKLNVSYTIPKLGAEEGIKEGAKKSPFDSVPNSLTKPNSAQKNNDNTSQVIKTVKPKTLAEMRRNFEKNQKRATKAETQWGSYVYYGNKKIKVPTTKIEGSKCLARIEPPKTEPPEELSPLVSPNRKLSMLSILTPKPASSKVRYRAGPLSRKSQLQDGATEWRTEVKQLPKVYLEVIPEFGKPLEPQIAHLVPIFDDPVISETRVEFALTALYTKTPETQKEQLPKKKDVRVFRMPVPYRYNQESVLVRRRVVQSRCVRDLTTTADVTESETDIRAGVDIVIGKLLNYVETKELADSIFTVDDSVVKDEEEEPLNNNIDPPEMERPTLGRKKRVRKRKLDLELMRLNCKVISVEDDAVEQTSQCTKPYCQMGCVCKSLACDGMYSNHCQLVKCMFECKCTPRIINEITSTSNSLSTYTVSQLDDKAKKNLAKEEREFTQTIIHAGKDTIVVSSGGRSKVRRACKTPKKYVDYVDSRDGAAEAEETEEVAIPDDISLEPKPCSVPLERLNLESVIPLCLSHKMHNCFCNGTATMPVKRKFKSLETLPKKMRMSMKQPAKEASPSPSAPTLKTSKESTSTSTKDADSSSATTTKSPESEDRCARLRPVFDEYRVRNKTTTYKMRLGKLRMHCTELVSDRNANVTDEGSSRPNKRKQSFDVRRDVEATKPLGPPRKKKTEERRILPKPNSQEDTEPETDATPASPRPSTSPITDGGVESIFEGEIIVYLRDNMDMLQIIGRENAHLEYIRILPWSALMDSFRRHKIDIWCLMTKPNVLLCNRAPSPAPKKFVDIRMRLFHTKTIDWILTDVLPPDKPRHLMNVILTPNNNNFSISGFCLRNNDQTALGKNVKQGNYLMTKGRPGRILSGKPAGAAEASTAAGHTAMTSILKQPLAVTNTAIPQTSLTNSTVVRQPSPAAATGTVSHQRKQSETNSKLILLPPNRSLKCSHKNSNNETKTLILTNREFALQTLQKMEEAGDEEIEANLPKLSKSHGQIKWRMIYLNSDFSFLIFKASKYSIKYTDLMDVVNMSKNINRTITLRNDDFTQSFKHSIFGIFCVPGHQDRLFVGPYLHQEEANVETFRYVNGKLVNTSLFNQMRGRLTSGGSIKNPTWMVEKICKPSHTEVLIDITEDDEEVTHAPESTANGDPDEHKELWTDQHLMCAPFVKEVSKNTLLYGTACLNRYHCDQRSPLGYFPAFQHPDRKTIDVFWPGTQKGYRFPTPQLASDSITQYLTMLLCPVPKKFKINVLIMMHLDPMHNKPVAAEVLSGTTNYICGDFGLLKRDDVTTSHLEAMGVSSLSKLVNKDERELDNELKLISIFGQTMMSEELFKRLLPEEILDWADDEIATLERTQRFLEAEKQTLKKDIAAKERYLLGLYQTPVQHSLYLPPAELKIVQPPSLSPAVDPLAQDEPVVDTIEISDSEEEAEAEVITPAPPTSSVRNTFQRIVTSGKIQHGVILQDRSLLKPNLLLGNAAVAKKSRPAEQMMSILKVRYKEFKLPVPRQQDSPASKPPTTEPNPAGPSSKSQP